jgi:hypothetical protein
MNGKLEHRLDAEIEFPEYLCTTYIYIASDRHADTDKPLCAYVQTCVNVHIYIYIYISIVVFIINNATI